MRLVIVALFSLAVAALAAEEAANAEAIKPAEKVAKTSLAALDSHNGETAGGMAYERELKNETSGRVLRRPMFSGPYLVEKRKSLGKVKSRTLVKTDVSHDHFQVPTGLFVRFTYAVQFEKHQTETKEIVTIKADNPQRWKVVSYATLP